MVTNTDETEIKPTSFIENNVTKFNESQISASKPFSDQVHEAALSKKTASLPCKNNNLNVKFDLVKSDEQERRNDNATLNTETAELDKKLSNNTNQKSEDRRQLKENPLPKIVVIEAENDEIGAYGKQAEVADTTNTVPEGILLEKTNGNTSKIKRFQPVSQIKRPSEIPKMKSISKTSLATQKSYTFPSRLPIKLPKKEEDKRAHDDVGDVYKSKREYQRSGGKTCKIRKEQRDNDEVKQAMSEDFGYIVPLYEKEFKKISDVWVNTVYCSLTMRTNLVKLLFQAFPNVNRDQFHAEDERLLDCLAHAKGSTKAEAENLKKLIKNLVANRDKTKNDYSIASENREIAEYYNHDWKKLIKRVTELGEETRKLQMETPELQKKKEFSEVNMNEKIRRLENNLSKKEEEIKKLANQLNILRQKEAAYKDSALLKIADYQEIKADVNSLISTQKEFDELKAKYLFQNVSSEKKIKDLEYLLEEKKKVLEKEREIKKQLQNLLDQLQAHQKRLTSTVGSEQIDYVLGRSFQERGKRREQLWIAAVKLVLKGFIIQMKKLERDRNKMLLGLQSSDIVNSVDFATIIKKDNFIKSIQQQMNELQRICTCSSVTSPQD